MTSLEQNAAIVQLGDMSEQDLALRARSGSLPCFIELVSRFESRIYNFLVRRLRHAADAEDVTQETFLRAWQAIAKFRSGNAFSTWLFTIAGRLAIDHHRNKRRALGAVAQHGQDAKLTATPLANEQFQIEGRALWDLASTLLSHQQHAALWLRYAEDLSIADIAGALGCTQVSIRIMLMRARNRLAAHFVATQSPTSLKGALPCSVR